MFWTTQYGTTGTTELHHRAAKRQCVLCTTARACADTLGHWHQRHKFCRNSFAATRCNSVCARADTRCPGMQHGDKRQRALFASDYGSTQHDAQHDAAGPYDAWTTRHQSARSSARRSSATHWLGPIDTQQYHALPQQLQQQQQRGSQTRWSQGSHVAAQSIPPRPLLERASPSQSRGEAAHSHAAHPASRLAGMVNSMLERRAPESQMDLGLWAGWADAGMDAEICSSGTSYLDNSARTPSVHVGVGMDTTADMDTTVDLDMTLHAATATTYCGSVVHDGMHDSLEQQQQQHLVRSQAALRTGAHTTDAPRAGPYSPTDVQRINCRFVATLDSGLSSAQQQQYGNMSHEVMMRSMSASVPCAAGPVIAHTQLAMQRQQSFSMQQRPESFSMQRSGSAAAVYTPQRPAVAGASSDDINALFAATECAAPRTSHPRWPWQTAPADWPTGYSARHDAAARRPTSSSGNIRGVSSYASSLATSFFAVASGPPIALTPSQQALGGSWTQQRAPINPWKEEEPCTADFWLPHAGTPDERAARVWQNSNAAKQPQLVNAHAGLSDSIEDAVSMWAHSGPLVPAADPRTGQLQFDNLLSALHSLEGASP